MVALRAVDLAPALLPPAPAQPGGGPGPGPGPGPAQPAREVLLCTARPLFLATSPSSTRLLWHGNSREWGLCDAATLVSEDGAEHDCFFANPRDCRCQVRLGLRRALQAGGGWAGRAGEHGQVAGAPCFEARLRGQLL